jgi:general stress protein YciG
MDNDKQRLIASKGGRAAHAKGTAHEWSSDEARAAGRKGGESRGTPTSGNNRQEPQGDARNQLSGALQGHSFLNDAGSGLRTQR